MFYFGLRYESGMVGGIEIVDFRWMTDTGRGCVGRGDLLFREVDLPKVVGVVHGLPSCLRFRMLIGWFLEFC